MWTSPVPAQGKRTGLLIHQAELQVHPAMTDKNKLRYDVGLIVNGNPDIALDIRKIPDGIYAVFELPHTEQDITAFWSNIQKLVGSLSVDETKPVIERYPADKVAKHLCEFCIPLKKLS